MKNMMDEIKYVFHAGKYNELRMIKHIPQVGGRMDLKINKIGEQKYGIQYGCPNALQNQVKETDAAQAETLLTTTWFS